MQATAKVRYLRTTGRKARLVADAVRGKSVGDALTELQFGMRKEVAGDVAKVVKSAVANLQSSSPDTAIEVDGLHIKEIRVDNGPMRGWYRARAQGRVGRILRKTCHITVTVSS